MDCNWTGTRERVMFTFYLSCSARSCCGWRSHFVMFWILPTVLSCRQLAPCSKGCVSLTLGSNFSRNPLVHFPKGTPPDLPPERSRQAAEVSSGMDMRKTAEAVLDDAMKGHSSRSLLSAINSGEANGVDRSVGDLAECHRRECLQYSCSCLIRVTSVILGGAKALVPSPTEIRTEISTDSGTDQTGDTDGVAETWTHGDRDTKIEKRREDQGYHVSQEIQTMQDMSERKGEMRERNGGI